MTQQRIIGYRRDGRPIHLIGGASGEGQSGQQQGQGDGGEARLTQADVDRIVAERLARDRAGRPDPEEHARLQRELEELRAAQQTESERAVTAARAEGAAAERERLSAVAVRQAAQIAAAQAAYGPEESRARFRNPELAPGLIDLSGVSLAEDGTVDSAVIRERLTARAQADPYLLDVAPPDPGPQRKPDPTQGRAGGRAAPGASGVEEARKRFPQLAKDSTT